MKLRNKKTGETPEFKSLKITFKDRGKWELTLKDDLDLDDIIAVIRSVWEEYNPAESLIKDEKIRKAVRAWATITFEWGKYTENKVRVGYEGDDIYCFKIFDCLFEIPLSEKEAIADGEYTIDELCGEEK